MLEINRPTWLVRTRKNGRVDAFVVFSEDNDDADTDQSQTSKTVHTVVEGLVLIHQLRQAAEISDSEYTLLRNELFHDVFRNTLFPRGQHFFMCGVDIKKPHAHFCFLDEQCKQDLRSKKEARTFLTNFIKKNNQEEELPEEVCRILFSNIDQLELPEGESSARKRPARCKK